MIIVNLILVRNACKQSQAGRAKITPGNKKHNCKYEELEMKHSLLLALSLSFSQVSFAFTSGQCNNCTDEVKAQVEDLKKELQLEKADVVVLSPGEKGVEELKASNPSSMDDTDVVLIPMEEKDAKGKKHSKGFIILTKGAAAATGVLATAGVGFTGFLLGFIHKNKLPFKNSNFIKQYGPISSAVLSALAAGVLSYVGYKKFTNWVLGPLPATEEKSTSESHDSHHKKAKK